MHSLELPGVGSKAVQRIPRDVLNGAAIDSVVAQSQWASFVKRNFANYSFGLCAETNFTINARSRTCQEFMAARLRTVSGRVLLQRGHKEIQEDAEDRYVIYLPLRGTQHLVHYGRGFECSPGSICLVSFAEPLRKTKYGDTDTLYFVVPKGFLDARVILRAEACGHCFSAKTGIWHLVAEAVRACYSESENMRDDEFVGLARRIADLFAFALQGGALDSVATDSVRSSNLARVKRVMKARLQDCELTLEAVARECGISLRYLHQLFKAESNTAQEYLRGERLQFARRMLETASDRAITVTDIALASGFTNLSHFSTAFREAFGCRPRDVLRGH